MAEKDRIELKAESDSLFPDNTTQDITPQRKRQFDQDMIDSNLNITTTDPQVIAGPISVPGGITGLSVNAVPVLVANDFTDQNPAGVDITTQVKFGAAQFTGLDPVMIDAAGTVTFNEGVTAANLVILVSFGRAGTGGTAEMFLRTVLDFGGGDIFSEPVIVKVDSVDVQSLTFIQALIGLPAGTELRVEMVRDPIGVDAGGLLSITPTAAGWPLANASATITITCIEVS